MRELRAALLAFALTSMVAATPADAQQPAATPMPCDAQGIGVRDAAARPETHAQHAGMMNHPSPKCVGTSRDSTERAFTGVQKRGAQAMGVDQYTSTHRFDVLPDGGRIELQRNLDDSAGVLQIRTHLQGIALAFRSGDFTTPAFVHMDTVPGTVAMAAKRAVIIYTFRPLPRGGELRMLTTDPDALRAIHQFIAFQRADHRAP